MSAGDTRRAAAERIAAPLLVIASVLVAFWALVHTAGRHWWPINDDAAIWLRSWDVGSRHTPLVGPHSRLGFHHPGPLMFYLLAIPIRLLRGRPSGLLVGAMLIALSSAATLVFLTARSAGPGAALVLALTTAALCVGLADHVVDPWNPWVITVPFALFLVAAWLTAAGDNASAPVAVVAGTFAAQSHLGALPPFLLIGAAALGLRFLRPPKETFGPSTRRAAVVTCLVFLILWAGPLIEQVTATRGNFSLIARAFGKNGPDEAVGWLSGTAMAGTQLLPWGPWLGRETLGFLNDVVPAPFWQVALCFLPVAVAGGLAWRFRDDMTLRLVTLVLVAIFACIAANAHIRGGAFAYLTLWSRPIAMMATAAPGIAIARIFFQRGKRLLVSRAHSVALGLAIVTSAISVRAMTADVPVSDLSRIYERVVPYAVRSVPPGATVYVLGLGPPYTVSAEAIAVGLEISGRIAKMSPWMAWAVGEHRTIADPGRLPVLFLATGHVADEPPAAVTGPPIFRHDPLSPAQRAEVRSLRHELRNGLLLAKRSDLMTVLDDADWWFSMVAPPSLPADKLARYFALTFGEDKVPVALFPLPPGGAAKLNLPSSLTLTAFTPERPNALCAASPRTSCQLDQIDGEAAGNSTSVARTGPVLLTGWAADTSTATVPPVVVLELVGTRSFYASAIRLTKRPDVVTATHQPSLLGSGFDALATFGAVDPGSYGMRITQVSSAGDALVCDTGRTLHVE